jgi:hypothetical protein
MPNNYSLPAVSTATHFDPNTFPPRDSLDATVAWLRIADEIDPDRKALLWYNRYGDAYGPVFRQFSAASHFWQERLVNEAFPALDTPIYDADARPATLPTQGKIFILSSESDVFVKARRAFEEKGRDLEWLDVRPFSYKTINFAVYACEVREPLIK